MNDATPNALLRHAATQVHGRYFVRVPPSGPSDLWFVGFHGQAQTAHAFLADLERVPRTLRWMAVSVQGLNTYYAGRSLAVVANWMTSEDRELAIADNVAWVNTVLDGLRSEFGSPRAIVFTGFSQGVAMAYRAGVLGRHECAAIIAVGGDVPPELLSGKAHRWPRVLAATGAKDAWYTPARLDADVELLRSRGTDVQALVVAGGHELTDEVCERVSQLLAEVERDAGP